jgi:soluble lytic murein transglycosylase-like protein
MRALVLLSLVMVPLTASAEGDVFRYVEKDGTIIYTNVKPSGSQRARRVGRTVSMAARPSDPPRARAAVPAEYESLITAAARRYRIPEGLVWAVMHAESNFDPRAVSPKGASGLMQLMPQTASEMYVRDIFDVRENIEGGTRYLRVLANQFGGDMVKMVAAYNAGPEAVRRYGGAVPPYEETRDYVRKVLELYYQYKGRERAAAEPVREARSDGDDARDGTGGAPAL